ncbi:MAG: tRNA (adenosine(37)-N6)-dimethylallyltransferase MiaA [Elusimicrobia bacterium GWA2_66_18]|nr:MAG: tRNA (adenosine(37)-N6)-dimethylallyltransferase MiaA [Elusimicrobia bacterium GWA2_66_18]
MSCAPRRSSRRTGRRRNSRRVIVIVGPTASGKTDLAAALAERLGGEVLCADSRQVYRALDAATAKPPAELRARVPHHLVDVADPAEAYDAGRFAREAAAALALIRGRGKVPIVCGGTGLYVRALIEGLTSLPPRDPAVRARLAALAEREGWNSLHARLALADPSAAASIPAANTQRVMRALEVLELTGRPISEHWAEGRSGGGKPSAVLRLDLPPHALRENIDRRTRAMWPALLAEVRALVPARFRGDEPGFTSLGYRSALTVTAGIMNPEQGLAEMLRATNAYAKRQRTWFRTQIDAIAVDASDGPESILQRALRALEDIREAATA